MTVHLANFKRTQKDFEEKETDVAIGVALLEVSHNDNADCVFIMSGDTDIMPALRAARRMYSGCRIGFAFPYRRQNNSLRDAADIHFRIRTHLYAKHVLPNPVAAAGGREIHCPSDWLPTLGSLISFQFVRTAPCWSTMTSSRPATSASMPRRYFPGPRREWRDNGFTLPSRNSYSGIPIGATRPRNEVLRREHSLTLMNGARPVRLTTPAEANDR